MNNKDSQMTSLLLTLTKYFMLPKSPFAETVTKQERYKATTDVY